MKRLVYILALGIALSLGCAVGCVYAPGFAQFPALQSVEGHEEQDNRDRSKQVGDEIIPSNHEVAEAVIGESQNLVRLSNNRQQRVLSIFGGKLHHHGNNVPSTLHRNLNLFLHKKPRFETAPFCTANACDYYVYALRRLLC